MDLMEVIRGLSQRIAELERKSDNAIRHGTVEEVDAKNKLVRLRVGGTDDEPFESPWVPYGQMAGALKLHSPPSKGQQMTMFSPGGDFLQAVALPFHWSDQNPSPSDKEDEHVLTFGSWRLTLKAGELTIEGPEFTVKSGGSTFKVSGDGIVSEAGGTKHEVTDEGETTTGGKVRHDGKNIGKDHQHRDVMAGPSLTGPPIE